MPKTLKNSLARVALFCAAFATTAVLMLGVGAAFHDASSQPWLRDSPQARLAVALCKAHAQRRAQHYCIATQVAAALARDAGARPARLASLRLEGPDAPVAAR